MNLSSYLLVHESPQMTVLKLVLGGTIFTEGGHYSPVNNVQGDILGRGGGGGGGGDTVHYDTVRVTDYNIMYGGPNLTRGASKC